MKLKYGMDLKKTAFPHTSDCQGLWTVRQSIASHWNIFVGVARWIVSLFNKYFLKHSNCLIRKV
jgi:hypothetical protein